MPEQIIAALQQALLRNSKSTVLKGLGWLIGILLTGTIAASAYGKDKWLVVMLGICLGLAVLVYIAAFIYFAWKDPDLLRSEKYSIQKLAMQKGFIGDDLTGYVRVGREGSQEVVAAGGDQNER